MINVIKKNLATSNKQLDVVKVCMFDPLNLSKMQQNSGKKLNAE